MIILAIICPPLKQIWGCFWLFLQAQEENSYFTELAERVEYGNYGDDTKQMSVWSLALFVRKPPCPFYGQFS